MNDNNISGEAVNGSFMTRRPTELMNFQSWVITFEIKNIIKDKHGRACFIMLDGIA